MQQTDGQTDRHHQSSPVQYSRSSGLFCRRSDGLESPPDSLCDPLLRSDRFRQLLKNASYRVSGHNKRARVFVAAGMHTEAGDFV